MTEYLDLPNPNLRQGDIVLAPTVALLQGEGAAPHEVPPAPSRLGRAVRVAAWRASEGFNIPEVVAETLWSPVVVVSHDCQLEKDFNKRVRELIAGGMPEAEAVDVASADPDLDPWAVVAPLLPFEQIPEGRHAGIRSGDRTGYFPLESLPVDGGDYAVDLGRLSTVSVQLLPQRAKIASLAPASTAELRYKLAEAYSIRDLAVLTELEAMVGHVIVRAEALPRNRKKSALVLFLDNGESVHLEIRRPRDELPAEITRSTSSGR